MLVKSWNCTGLQPKLRTQYFRRWLADADIACLQETFVTSVRVGGFQVFVKPARTAPANQQRRPIGGLATLISSQLGAAFKFDLCDAFDYEGVESLCVRFTKIDACRDDLPSVFYVFNLYVVAQPPAFDFNGFYVALDCFLNLHECPVVLAGDFNAHLHPLSFTALPNARDRDFREFVARLDGGGVQIHPFTDQEVRKPTFISKKGCTVIDYVMVRGAPCSGFERVDLTSKGHRALQISVDWPQVQVSEMRDRTSYRRHFRLPPPQEFFDAFSSGYGLSSCADFLRVGVSHVFCFFVLLVGQLFLVALPSTRESWLEPWHRYLSRAELAKLLNLEKVVFDLLAGAQLGVAPLGLTEKSAELAATRRKLHSLATRRLFEEVRGSDSDPGKFWGFVRRFRTESGQDVLPINSLVKHFSAVFNRVGDPIPLVFCENFFAPTDSVLDSPFTLDELESVFRGLDRGTAPGVSGIGNDVLRDLYGLPGGPSFFLHLFNACLEGGSVPDAWRCTEIFLLYKGKGDVFDPGSYRGIGLMESSLKVFEKLLYNRLMAWAVEKGLIPDCQFGIRARAGTLDAVFVFFTLIAKYVFALKSQLYVSLIDFQRAFPSVQRSLLIDKLGSMGVSTNTFSLRSGAKVTREFPVITGLREGSVLSPLLFSLLMADIQSFVLRPFSRDEFLKKDPSLNGIPTPGLLYADDLVLFCLTGDLLRARLARLARYAEDNNLTVNVSKCEVVVFGRLRCRQGFKFRGQLLPMRDSCKYLGVWLDRDGSSCSLGGAIKGKFVSAVPVFFALCRKLRLSRLDLVFRLANSLLFSLLYGVEFLGCLDVVRKCEEAWWAGVRSFYGLPNGVSKVFLLLLFPRFSLLHRAVLARYSLLLRAARPVDTIFPEAVIEDRSRLFPVYRVGFSQGTKEWSEQLGLERGLLFSPLRTDIVEALESRRQRELDSAWESFSSMASTRYVAAFFPNRAMFHPVMTEASRLSKLGLRVVVLAFSGALFLSYFKTRSCFDCRVHFSAEHFFTCPALGPDISGVFRGLVMRSEWRGAVALVLSRFQVIVHRWRGGALLQEESELFSLMVLEEMEEEEEPERSIQPLFS